MASEGSGNPEAQYKLGFLYGSNFGGALGGVEGTGKQGSASLSPSFTIQRNETEDPVRRPFFTTPSPLSRATFPLR
jgi:hypothetical protein